MYENVFVIAEIGMNHNGSLALAKSLVDEAVAIGVDAVKFQTHIFEAESLPEAPAPEYFKAESRKDFFERTAFTEQQWRDLKEYIREKGRKFIVSPFSIEAIKLLEQVGVDLYKVPSGEVTNVLYLEELAGTGKPVILSSGMSNWVELDMAVETILKKNKYLAVLQCTSSYPCSCGDVGLNMLAELRDRYCLPVGLSDHTTGIYASLAAVTLGAKIIERHFTLSRNAYGPDARFSLEPGEMKMLVEGIRCIEEMLSHKVNKDNIGQFREMKMIFEKSVVARMFIPKGTVVTREMLAFKKPGNGLRADRFIEIVGKRTNRDIFENSMILREYVE